MYLLNRNLTILTIQKQQNQVLKVLKFSKKHLKRLVPMSFMLALSMSCFNRYSSANIIPKFYQNNCLNKCQQNFESL